MRISRKRLLVAGAAAGAFGSSAFLRYPGDAAEFTYKLGNDQPLVNPMTANSIKAAKQILDATGGRVEIKVFPASALGDDVSMITQLRTGALELLQIGNNILAGVLPAAALEGIPFAFPSHAELMKAAAGPLGSYIGAAAAKLGLYKFAATWYGGTFQIQNNVRPIVTPADLKGIKIRVPPGPIDVATFKAFGALATPIPAAEMYVSVQTHLVDAVELPLPTFQNFKLYELVKYVSITNHYSVMFSMMANAAAWQKLPKNLQEIVERELNAAITQASEQDVQVESTIEGTLRSEGLVFNRPDIEPFRQIIRSSGLYGQWRDSFDPQGWTILEKAVGKLA